MFFAFTRSSTSNRTSIGTPNSNRSLMIRSTRSRVFIWSVGAALCFLPRGVGQLLNMTSSMILGVRKHQTVLVNKGPERLTFHPAASQCTLQYHKFFSSPGREGGKGAHQSRNISTKHYLVHKLDHFGLSLRLGHDLLRLLHHLKVILRHPWSLDWLLAS